MTARDRVHLLFELLIAILEQQGGGVLRLTESFQAHDLWRNGIDGALRELLVEINAIGQGLTMVQERIESEPERAEELTSIVNEIRAVTRRLAAAGDALMQGLVPPASGPPVVRWIEPMGKPGLHERNILVQCVPIDLAPSLRDDLFRRVRTAVVTSATLSTDGGFGFISQRLGVSHLNRPIRSAIFPSPFDYPRQALLVVPTDLPAPNEQPKEHLASVVEHLCGLVEASDGGIFALFTSHRDVRDVADRLRKLGIAARRPLLVHGEEPRDQLLQLFRESGRALLLGTATFWEGVDVPGNALRGLLIGRLPFLVPTDPMVAAQCEVIDARGGSSFAEYMLPHAALRLKQGFGRLIRTTNDCGVVVLSDPRVVTRRYGRALLNSLPPAQRIIGAWRDIGVHVSRFYRYGPSVIRQTVWDES